MKTILFIATSLNGYIARENGDEDFLSHENWKSFSKKVEELGNFVIGRKTYEAVKGWDEDYGFDDFINATKIILTTSDDYTVPDGYLAAHSPREALQILEEKGYATALVTGGAKINSVFAKQGLLDEIILNVEPIIIGAGLPLFSEDNFDLKLKLLDEKRLDDGIIQLHYSIGTNT